MLRQVLEEKGVSIKYILTQPGRRTLTKQSMVESQLLLRFAQDSIEAIDSKTEQALIEQLSSCFVDCEALIVSDYGYGMTAGLIEAITKLQHLGAYRQLNAIAVKPN
jgi:D-beta-D-heptose 7-phosphate kinase/D-beta-D-heptose 1-phosphate adenosyltransferase